MSDDGWRRLTARLATTQHGVVARHQLRELGMTEAAIDFQVGEGWLHRIHFGVYFVGHAARTVLACEMAAVLALGPPVFVSHHSAARLWRMLPPSPDAPIDVIAVAKRARPRRGMVLHQTSVLDEVDRKLFRDAIPLTAPARTLLDLAAVAKDKDFEAAVGKALVADLCDVDDVTAVIERYPLRQGVKRLRAYLGLGLAKPSRSPLERKFHRLVLDAGLPDPQMNVLINGFEVDFYWPAARLVVEVDGRRFHASDDAYERDRWRDSELSAAKYRVVRFSWRQVTKEPKAVINRLKRILATTSGPDP